MPDLPDRFRALDQLEVPDIDQRARALGPRPPTEPDGPSPAKRTTVTVGAFADRPGRRRPLSRAFRQEAKRRRPARRQRGVRPGSSVTVLFPSPVGSVIALVRPDGSNFHALTQKSSLAPDVAGDPWIRRYGFAADDKPHMVTRRHNHRVRALLRRRRRFVVHDRRPTGTGLPHPRSEPAGCRGSPGRPTDRSSPTTRSETAACSVMNADGSERLMPSLPRSAPRIRVGPSWSPDGRWVYFAQGKISMRCTPTVPALHEVIDTPLVPSVPPSSLRTVARLLSAGGRSCPRAADGRGTGRPDADGVEPATSSLRPTKTGTLLGWAQDRVAWMLAPRWTTDGCCRFSGSMGDPMDPGLTRVEVA